MKSDRPSATFAKQARLGTIKLSKKLTDLAIVRDAKARKIPLTDIDEIIQGASR